MAAILSTNMASLYAQRSMATAQAELSGSVEKLSSGKRINSAKDDAAGLAIAESIAGIRNISDQSIRSLGNAVSIVQTAEGALDVVNNILQRALTLSTQKVDESLNDVQRASIDSEIAILLDEIGRIRDRTMFNSNETIFGRPYSFSAGPGVSTTFTIPNLSIPDLGIGTSSRVINLDNVNIPAPLDGVVEPFTKNISLNEFPVISGTVAAAVPSNSFNITSHGFNNGDVVMYRANGGSSIDGLDETTSYVIDLIDANSFRLLDPSDSLNVAEISSLGGAADSYFLNFTQIETYEINGVGTDLAITDTLLLEQGWSGGLVQFQEAGTPLGNSGDLDDGGVYEIFDQQPNYLKLRDLDGNVIYFNNASNLQDSQLVYFNQNPPSHFSSTSNPNRINLGSTPVGTLSLGDLVFYSGPVGYGLTPNSFYSVRTKAFSYITLTDPATSLEVEVTNTLLSGEGKRYFHWSTRGSENTATFSDSNPLLPSNTFTVKDFDDAVITEGAPIAYIDDSLGPAPITPNLVNGGLYFAINVDPSTGTFQVSGDGTIGGLVDITAYDLNPTLRPRFDFLTKLTFDSTDPTVVGLDSGGANIITFSSPHGFLNGDEIVYKDDGAGIGLIDSNTYKVINVNSTSIRLATQADPTDPLALDAGSGSFYFIADSLIQIDNHGFETGDRITYSVAGGTGISGIEQESYIVIRNDDNSFRLANPATPNTPLSLLNPGNGTHTFTAGKDFFTIEDHGYSTGDLIQYTSDHPIGPLENNGIYKVIVMDANNIYLSDDGEDPINLTDITIPGQAHQFAELGYFESTNHGLSTRDPVTYSLDGLSVISPLENDETYYVIRIDNNKFRVASSLENAEDGIPIVLTSDGAGDHSFITAEESIVSIETLQNAIAVNSSNRAELGSRLNMLNFAIDNLSTLSNNLSDAYSRIMDVDYASETANLTKNKILQEASAAMLAQANQMPNVVLTLLK